LAATFSVTLLVPVQVPVPMLLALPQVPLQPATRQALSLGTLLD
jgi:hypothetical protein